MNNNFFNASKDNWFIKQSPKYKPIFPIATVKEPVVTKLPHLKTVSEPKVTQYSKGGNKKESLMFQPTPQNFFGVPMSSEVTRIMKENAPNKNSGVIQESFDKFPSMWYYKSQNNSSGAGVGSLLGNVPTAGLQNIGKVKKTSENNFPEKEDREDGSKRRSDFFADLDLKNLPTEEEMDFADGAFGSQPGFLEDNNILRSISRYIRSGENTATDDEIKGQATRRTYEDKYRARLAEAEKIKAAENESKRQAARRAYEEKYRAELAEEKRKQEQALEEAFEIYFNYFSEADREKIRNGEGIASFLDGVNPEETDQIYNYLQENFKNLDPEVQKEFGFYAEDIFGGVPLEIRRKIFSKLKKGEVVTYDDLVAFGLYDGEEKFFEKWAANDFTSLVNKAYDLYLKNNSFDELSFDYNQQQAAQAQALLMEVLMGRVNGDPIELVPNSKKEIKVTQQPVNSNKPTMLEQDNVVEYIVDDFIDPKTKQKVRFEKNKKIGATAETMAFLDKEKAGCYSEKQITIVTPFGRKTRMDIMSITPDGKLVLTEVKGSLTTWLNPNQKKVLPEIYQFGGKVVGKGKGIFKGGYEVQPGAKIEVVNIDVKGDGRRVYTGIK